MRDVCLTAHANQDLPFDKVVDELRLPRDLGRSPLGQVAFALQNSPMPAIEIPQLTVMPMMIDSGIAKTDLIVSVSEVKGALRCNFDYSVDLFDAATIAGMAGHFHELLESIVAEPQCRIAALAPPRASTSPRTHPTPIHTELQDETYERSNLTMSQTFFWLGQKLRPDVPLYNMVCTFTIAQAIQVEHFQSAFQTIVNSSDALRTVIRDVDGVPQRRVITNFPDSTEYLDLSQAPNPESALRTWVRERSQILFDIERCMFDSVLIKITDEKYVWYLNKHHIISDAWTTSLILQWMSKFYQQSLDGHLPPRHHLPAFQDYVDYEREYRKSSRYADAATYWNRKMATEVPPVPFYGKVPRKTTAHVQRVSYDLGQVRTQRLREIANRETVNVGRLWPPTTNVSLCNLFLAILCAYLHGISGNRLLSIGIPFHNRRTPAFRNALDYSWKCIHFILRFTRMTHLRHL